MAAAQRRQRKSSKKQPNKEPVKEASNPRSRRSQREGGGSSHKKKRTRPVVYKEPGCVIYGEENPLTEEVAKEILGWQEESENIDLKAKFQFKDRYGKRVFLRNNTKNRPLYMQNVADLVHEILEYTKNKKGKLERNWALNGDTVSLGRTGLVINGQHSLIALVLACQDWERASAESRIRRRWKRKPYLVKFVATGIEETDRVMNTVDTCRPRSLTDVLFRHSDFSKLPQNQRKRMASAVAHAIGMLWKRTGVKDQAYVPRSTKTELVDFLTRHHKVIEAARHILEEEQKRSISGVLSLGYASALLYLMGTSSTDTDETNYNEQSDETQLDFSNWDYACEFWTILGSGGELLQPVREAVADLVDGGTLNEKLSIVALAWAAYMEEGDIAEAVTQLAYKEDEYGVKQLLEVPTVGGIDLGQS